MSTINGEAPNAHNLLSALIDIYDDAQNNAPEHRCYVPEAWPDVLKEARTFLAADPAITKSEALLRGAQWLAAAPATKADSTEAEVHASWCPVTVAKCVCRGIPEAPSHSAPSEPTDLANDFDAHHAFMVKQQAAHEAWWNLHDMDSFFNLTTKNQSCAAWKEGALRATLPEAQAKPASATAEPIGYWHNEATGKFHAVMPAWKPPIPGGPAQAAEPRQAPSDAPFPQKEVDALLDHIYEHGTTAGGVKPRIQAIIRAAIAAQEQKEPTPPL